MAFLAFAFGFLSCLAGSWLWVIYVFREARERPCSACGRWSAVVCVATDLETRDIITEVVLCDPCFQYTRKHSTKAPWV